MVAMKAAVLDIYLVVSLVDWLVFLSAEVLGVNVVAAMVELMDYL